MTISDKLPDGHYCTEAGSEVTLRKNGGVAVVNFDWFEEPGACCDCEVEPYPEEDMLIWYCDFCGGGSAQLLPFTPPAAG